MLEDDCRFLEDIGFDKSFSWNRATYTKGSIRTTVPDANSPASWCFNIEMNKHTLFGRVDIPVGLVRECFLAKLSELLPPGIQYIDEAIKTMEEIKQLVNKA